MVYVQGHVSPVNIVEFWNFQTMPHNALHGVPIDIIYEALPGKFPQKIARQNELSKRSIVVGRTERKQHAGDGPVSQHSQQDRVGRRVAQPVRGVRCSR